MENIMHILLLEIARGMVNPFRINVRGLTYY